jgi:hypothetical protein
MRLYGQSDHAPSLDFAIPDISTPFQKNEGGERAQIRTGLSSEFGHGLVGVGDQQLSLGTAVPRIGVVVSPMAFLLQSNE